MSTIEAKIVKVTIKPHPNADRLEIARIGDEGGFECVVALDQFKTGDLALYIPVDSIVPQNIRDYLAQTKVNVKDGRIRCAKIRNKFSEGLCLSPQDWVPESEIKEGNNVTEIVGIKKYEPPPPHWRTLLGTKHGISLQYENRNFIEYTCVEKFKKYPDVLEDGELVVATVKWHGTNFRAGLVKRPPYRKNLWEKIKGLFFKESALEFLVGSHAKIRYPSKKSWETGEYKQDSYWRMAEKYNLEAVARQISKYIALTEREYKDNVEPEVIIYAEIIGPGIQKGYGYGIENGELEIRVFDIMVDKTFLPWDRVVRLCSCFNLPTVTEVYRGPWSLDVVKHAKAVDEYAGKKFNREGIVIRPLTERWSPECGRVIFKYLNEVYLLNKTNSEWH